MALLNTSDWANYTAVINQASDSFNKEVITWKRLTKNIPRYGEDNPSDIAYTDISLECLVQYNVNRTWPITKETKSGELDKENVVVIFNTEYLRGLGYLDSNGYFNFRADQDMFVLHGKKYKPAGDTEAAQTSTQPLLFYLILERYVKPTGTK